MAVFNLEEVSYLSQVQNVWYATSKLSHPSLDYSVASYLSRQSLSALNTCLQVCLLVLYDYIHLCLIHPLMHPLLQVHIWEASDWEDDCEHDGEWSWVLPP